MKLQSLGNNLFEFELKMKLGVQILWDQSRLKSTKSVSQKNTALADI